VQNFKDGLKIRATQQKNLKEKVDISRPRLRPGYDGLTVAFNVGREVRGYRVSVTLSLHEIASWLPQLIKECERYAVRQAEISTKSAAADQAKKNGRGTAEY
jgi:hypothetical protein